MTDDEARDLRQQVEYGRKCKAAGEVLADFLLEQRAQVINKLESESFEKAEDFLPHVIYLRTLRVFELETEKYISLGEIVERRLNEDGD